MWGVWDPGSDASFVHEAACPGASAIGLAEPAGCSVVRSRGQHWSCLQLWGPCWASVSCLEGYTWCTDLLGWWGFMRLPVKNHAERVLRQWACLVKDQRWVGGGRQRSFQCGWRTGGRGVVVCEVEWRGGAAGCSASPSATLEPESPCILGLCPPTLGLCPTPLWVSVPLHAESLSSLYAASPSLSPFWVSAPLHSGSLTPLRSGSLPHLCSGYLSPVYSGSLPPLHSRSLPQLHSGSLSPLSLGPCPPKGSVFLADAPKTVGPNGLELPRTASAGARANQLCCAAVLHRATWTIKPKLALKVEVLSVLRGSEGICMSEQYVKGAILSDSVLA